MYVKTQIFRIQINIMSEPSETPLQKKLPFGDEMVQNAHNHHITLTEEVYQNFFSKIEEIDADDPSFVQNKCYLWTGAKRQTAQQKGNQHGQFNCGNQKTVLAHRFMHILTGELKYDDGDRDAPCPCHSGKKYGYCCRPQVNHKCKEITGEDHNGACVNPFHLALGTAAENQHDIRIHGTAKGGYAPGAAAHQATMSDEKAAEVWADIQGKEITLKAVAAKHGISENIVKDMSRGKTWNIITGLPKEKFNNQRKTRDENKYQATLNRKRKEPDTSVIGVSDGVHDVAVNTASVLNIENGLPPPKTRRKMTDETALSILTKGKNLNEMTLNKACNLLGKEFNVHPASVRDLLTGKTYKHLQITAPPC
jgi:hypothetical protein